MSDLVVDASTVRIGGGVSRVQELALTLPALSASNRYRFVTSPEIARSLPRHGTADVHTVPSGLRRPWQVAAWEHLVLPGLVSKWGSDWVLAPFGVLPLGRRLPASTQTAVIVSSIAPFVLAVQEGLPPYQLARLRLLGSLMRASSRRADRVFFLSPEGRECLRNEVGDDRARLLPMAPPAPDVLPERSSADPQPVGSRYFVVVGELAPYKGIHDAIEALGRLRNPDISLLICGSVLARKYAAHLVALTNAVISPVLFMKNVPQYRVLAYMRSAVATVVCSRVENPGRVPVEAMAAGSPVIATDIPSIRSTCGSAALYYKPGDFSTLAQLMQHVLNDSVHNQLVADGQRRLEGNDWLSASRAILQAMDLL